MWRYESSLTGSVGFGQVESGWVRLCVRRHLSQLVHDVGDLAGGVVHFFFGGVAAQAEANRGAGQIGVEASAFST